MIHAARIIRPTIIVDRPSVLILRQEFLHFPIPLFCAYTEFEIFFGYGVPVLSE